MGKRRQNRERATPAPAPARHGGGVDPRALRVVGLVGHRASGKTSLGDLLCKVGRVTREVGSVDAGSSLLDWDAEERRHRQTQQIATAWLPWGDSPQEEQTIQLLDTPGTDLLPHERDVAIAAADGIVVVVDATRGVEHGTTSALRTVLELDREALAVITKIDRVGELPAVVREIGKAAGRRAVLVQLPFTDDDGRLVGVVDLVEGVVLRFDPETAAYSPEPIPRRLAAAVARGQEQLMEGVALCDDELLERYLEELGLPREEVVAGLKRAVARRALLPVLMASVPLRIGGQPLLDAMVRWLPSPVDGPVRAIDADGCEIRVDPEGGDCVAQLVATQFDDEGQRFHLLRMWAGALPSDGLLTHADTGVPSRIRKLYRIRGPRRAAAPGVVPGMVVGCWDPLDARPGDTLVRGARIRVPTPPILPPMTAWLLAAPDEEALGRALREVVADDVGLALHTDETSGGLLLASATEGHLRLATHRLRRFYGLEVSPSLPPVGYREMPRAEVSDVEGLHVREDRDGLVEEYGRCRLALAPEELQGALPVCADPVVVDDAVDDEEDLPERWRPAIADGVQRALEHGPTAGYPVVGARVKLTGGAYDCLQSTDDHFRLAGENGVRSALQRAGTRLLEPWWHVTVSCPADALGDLIGDIAAHRGRVSGMEVEGATAHIRAESPYRELRTFAGRLQQLTGGQGSFRAEPHHYEPLPESLVGEAIAESPFTTQRPRSSRPVPTRNVR